MKSKKATFKTIFYIVSISVLTFIIILLSINLFIYRNKNYLSYSENTNVDYKVNLKKNNYYQVDKLPSGMTYIANLIDNIEVNFNYLFESTKPVDYDSTYYVEAITRVYGDKTKSTILFEKSEVLLDNVKVNKSAIRKQEIDEKIKVDYAHFNQFVLDFKTDYALSSESEVIIVLHVKSDASNSNYGSVNQDSKASLRIPLTLQTIGIKIDKDNINNNKVLFEKFNINNDNMLYVIGFFVCSILDIILMLCLIFKFIKSSKRVSFYVKEKNRILKEYDLIIANVTSEIDTSNYQLINVESFSELVDIHDNIGVPILYYEEKKDNLCYFSIIKDNVLYRYKLENKQ